MTARTISPTDCSTIVRQRRRTHWLARFERFYEAIERSAQFLQALDEADLSVSSLPPGCNATPKPGTSSIISTAKSFTTTAKPVNRDLARGRKAKHKFFERCVMPMPKKRQETPRDHLGCAAL
ncbi:MAG: hypothetical protein ACOYYS_09930 [Chloroflexota bacterium]